MNHAFSSSSVLQAAPLPRWMAGSSTIPAAGHSPGHPLRILMVVESSAGGTGRHVMDLAAGLLARGCEVHMVYATQRMDEVFQQRLHELKDLRRAAVPMRRSIHPGDLMAVRAVRRYVRDCGPFDIVHGHSSKGGALARLAAIGTGAAAFYTLHGLIMLNPALPAWKRLLYRTLERGLSLCSARIIAVSPETARAAVRLGLGRRRVIMVPNGIGPMTLTPRAIARQALGVSEETPVIGFVGRLVEQKGPDVLINAFARAVKVVPRARLALVGSGPLQDSLRRLAQRLGVHDDIFWLGQREAGSFLAAFDLFAMSSRFEGLPYVALEAMSAGLPVVATTACGLELLLEPGRSGALAPPDDPEALAAAMTAMLSDAPNLQACGRAARARALTFTIDAMVDDTLAAYLAVAQSNRARLHPA